VWISRLGLHHDPKTLQLERPHFSPSGLLTLFQTEQTEGPVPTAPPSTNILFSQATAPQSPHHERLKKLFVSSRRRNGIEVPGEYTIVDHM
jgi:hypothetical protein